MVKRIWLVLILSLFLMSTSVSSFAYSSFTHEHTCYQSSSCDDTLSKDLYEWADGTFTGEISDDSGEVIGSISGYLQQKRNPNQGVFQGTIYDASDVEIGLIQGRFHNNQLFGIIKEHEKTPRIYVGSFTGNSSDFSAEIIIPFEGSYSIKGHHTDSFLPLLTGVYDVGIKSYHLIDTNRLERFTEDPDDYRELILQIWYPVSMGTPGERISYMDRPTFGWLFNRSPVPLVTIPDTAYEFVRPYSKQSPERLSSERFPVIIFSHGYDGVFQIYTSLIEDLVSHGYIVASINHPYVAGITVFPDGREIFVAPVQENISIESVVSDVTFVLDYLTILDETDSVLAGIMDFDHIGMYGHSFGGAATAICCYEDERIDAGLTLDGVVYEDRVPVDFNKPFLMLLAEGHRISMGSTYLWGLLDSDVYRVEVTGSTHYGYTDVGLLLHHFVPLIPQKILGFGTIDAKRLVTITKSYEIAFFDTYLKNASIESLYDIADEYDEILFEYQ